MALVPPHVLAPGAQLGRMSHGSESCMGFVKRTPKSLNRHQKLTLNDLNRVLCCGPQPKQMAQVKKLLKNKELANEAKMTTGGAATIGLYKWVTAMVKYYDVAKNVAPLRLKVATMEKEQAKSAKELAKIERKLSELTAMIADLNAKFEASNSELKKLKADAEDMEKRLTAAQRLIQGLGGEQKRWTSQRGPSEGEHE